MGFDSVIGAIAQEALDNAVGFLGDVSPLLGIALGVMVLGLMLHQLRRFM